MSSIVAGICLTLAAATSQGTPPEITIDPHRIESIIEAIPVPLIVAASADMDLAPATPLVFTVGQDDLNECLALAFPGCRIQSDHGVRTVIAETKADLLDSILLPEQAPAVAASLTSVVRGRFDLFNSCQSSVYLVFSTAESTRGSWVERDLVDCRMNEEALVPFLISLIRLHPKYSFLISVYPASELPRHWLAYEEIKRGGYESVILIRIAHFGWMAGANPEDAYAVRHYNLTGRSRFHNFIRDPRQFMEAILSTDSDDHTCAQAFLLLQPPECTVFRKALDLAEDPVAWARLVPYSRSLAAGRYKSPESARLYEILTTHADRIDAGTATRGAEYLAFTSDPRAGVYIIQVINQNATLDADQTEALLRALILLPDDQRPEGLNGREEWLREMIARQGDEGKMMQVRTAVRPEDAQ